MPLFEKISKNMIPQADSKWSPIYLEHGRIEVDDSSVKWVDSNGLVVLIPIAMFTCLLLGPGTIITHEAIKICAECNTMICWVGEDSMKFYSFGISPTHNNQNAIKQLKLATNKKASLTIARKMFQYRFADMGIEDKSLKDLRLMEGLRVKKLYRTLSEKHGVFWKRRMYRQKNFNDLDSINRAISMTNYALYSLCSSIICSMGYIPQIGFIHTAGNLSFVYDIADIFKPSTTLDVSFSLVSYNPSFNRKQILGLLKSKFEKDKTIKKIVNTIEELMK